MLGRNINLFYKGEEQYKTYLGTAVTFIVATGVLLMISLKFVEFFGEVDPISYFLESRQDMDEIIDFTEIGFSFAIETIEEEYGSIEVK